MPCPSERQQVLANLLNQVYAHAVVQLLDFETSDEESSDWSSNGEEVQDLYNVVLSRRYLRERVGVPKQSFCELLDHLDNAHWKNELRMSREAFNGVLDLIENDPVFSGGGI